MKKTVLWLSNILLVNQVVISFHFDSKYIYQIQPGCPWNSFCSLLQSSELHFNPEQFFLVKLVSCINIYVSHCIFTDLMADFQGHADMGIQ